MKTNKKHLQKKQVLRYPEPKKRKNRGSTIIEITLLIPIFLGCIYFFIMVFLFFISSGQRLYVLCEELYSVDIGKEQEVPGKTACGSLKKEGTLLKISYEDDDKWFLYHLSLQRNGNDSITNIRRWQLAADSI